MRCLEKASAFLDGELDADDCKGIEEHILECPECRHCIEALQRTIDFCKNLSRGDIPEEIQKRLRENLRECFSKSSGKAKR